MSRRHTPRTVADARAIAASLAEATTISDTDTAATIYAALTTIRDAWPRLENPPTPPGPGTRTPPASKPPTPIGPLSLQVEIIHTLAYWTRALVDDHPEGLPDDAPTLDLANHNHTLDHIRTEAAWAAGWTHGPLLAAELDRLAKRARFIAWPPTPSLALGPCPLLDEATGGRCDGIVRVEDDADSIDGGATCRRCRRYATIDWWYSHIVGNPEAKALVTAAEITTIAAYELGAILPRATIRKWVERGHLVEVDRDAGGRVLFDRFDAMCVVRRRLNVAVPA